MEVFMSVPQHVAIILDGNGRWAKAKGLPRTAGHTAGAKNVETIARDAYDLGIKYLTLYAFSTENWNRPDEEVEALMKLLGSYLKTCKAVAKKNNMRVRVIGDKTRLSEDMQKQIRELEAESAAYDGFNLTFAINYGSRDEIVRGIRKMNQDITSGDLSPDDITEENFSKYLDTADLPDPDLMIRTAGEVRTSGFLTWQTVYSEMYFTDVLWPDFDEKVLDKAIKEFNNRKRNFGK
jgi:undecaprenyl diphosphate synthase